MKPLAWIEHGPPEICLSERLSHVDCLFYSAHVFMFLCCCFLFFFTLCAVGHLKVETDAGAVRQQL